MGHSRELVPVRKVSVPWVSPLSAAAPHRFFRGIERERERGINLKRIHRLGGMLVSRRNSSPAANRERRMSPCALGAQIESENAGLRRSLVRSSSVPGPVQLHSKKENRPCTARSAKRC